jgi:hypothetical protein
MFWIASSTGLRFFSAMNRFLYKRVEDLNSPQVIVAWVKGKIPIFPSGSK